MQTKLWGARIIVSKEMWLEAHRFKRAGLSNREIHQNMNVPTSTVVRLLGMDMPPNRALDWSDKELEVLRRVLHERADIHSLQRWLPGRTVLGITQKLYRLRRDAGLRQQGDQGMKEVPRAADKAVPTVYRLTQHSGTFLDQPALIRKDRTLGAKVTDLFIDDGPPPERKQTLHGNVPGESNHYSASHHPLTKAWRF